MLAAGLMLPFPPRLPAQVLVQNLCFDMAQLAFAFDQPAPAVLRTHGAAPRDFLRFITGFGLLNATADPATFAVPAYALHGSATSGGQEAFHSAWFTENLLTQALVMLLLRTGRRTAEGHSGGPLRAAASGLAVVGLLLPLSPLGPLLGMRALPPLYFLLLATVPALYTCGLWAARTRYERKWRFS